MTKTVYVRHRKSDTWHWCKNCSHYPRETFQVKTVRGKDVSRIPNRVYWKGETQMQGYEHAKPTHGEFCNECLSKGKRKECRT
jgi:hypothetical protein